MNAILNQIVAPQLPMSVDIKNNNYSQAKHDVSYRKASEEDCLIYVKLDLINHFIGFIPCQICLYFSI